MGKQIWEHNGTEYYLDWDLPGTLPQGALVAMSNPEWPDLDAVELPDPRLDGPRLPPRFILGRLAKPWVKRKNNSFHVNVLNERLEEVGQGEWGAGACAWVVARGDRGKGAKMDVEEVLEVPGPSKDIKLTAKGWEEHFRAQGYGPGAATLYPGLPVRDDSPDLINQPPHYRAHPSGIECIEIAQWMNFNLGNVIKYVWRAGLKETEDTIKDLEKAKKYLEFEIERLKRVKGMEEGSR